MPSVNRPRRPRPPGVSTCAQRAAAVRRARSRLDVAAIYDAHLPDAYEGFVRYCRMLPPTAPLVPLYARLLHDVRTADLFPLPDAATLAARAVDDAYHRAVDYLSTLVVDPGLVRPLAVEPAWTHTIPTGSDGLRYRYDPRTASEGEALLLILAAPTYDEQPPRAAWAGPLAADTRLDGAGRRRLQRRLAAIARYADQREPCQWTYDADPLEPELVGALSRLAPPLDGLARAARYMNRSTGEPYLDDREDLGEDVLHDLPWSVEAVGDLAELWTRARPYRARALEALAALRHPRTFVPLVEALYVAVRAAGGDVVRGEPPPAAPLWQTLGLDALAGGGVWP